LCFARSWEVYLFSGTGKKEKKYMQLDAKNLTNRKPNGFFISTNLHHLILAESLAFVKK